MLWEVYLSVLTGPNYEWMKRRVTFVRNEVISMSSQKDDPDEWAGEVEDEVDLGDPAETV